MDADFIGKKALRAIRDAGVTRKQVGLRIDGPPLQGPNSAFWPILKGSKTIGKVTSAVYSPRLKQNIALAMVSADQAGIGLKCEVQTRSGIVPASVVEKPFFDPKKQITNRA